MVKKSNNNDVNLELGSDLKTDNIGLGDSKLTNDKSNIFDDFEDDKTLIEEVDKLKSEKNKDMFYYISKTGGFISTLFWVLIMIMCVIYAYIYIQNNKEISNSNLLDPFCPIILGDVIHDEVYCSSVSTLTKSYNSKKDELEGSQKNDILSIIEDLYNVVNFTQTRKVLFLLDKSENRLDILNILNEFDKVKSGFQNEKDKVQCSRLSIDAKSKTLSMSCVAYSGGFEKGIKGFDGTNDSSIKGTSVSIANSFLNYIEKSSQFFTLINRQKLFTSRSVVGEKTNFTNSTDFRIELLFED